MGHADRSSNAIQHCDVVTWKEIGWRIGEVVAQLLGTRGIEDVIQLLALT